MRGEWLRRGVLGGDRTSREEETIPEGDTIHRAAQVLQRALAGQEVVRFETALAQLARVNDDAPLRGRTIEAVEAVGKHLLIRFSGDLVLRTHMRMNGSWHLYRAGERWRRPRAGMRVALHTAAHVAVAFDVPVAELLAASALPRHRALSRLGPDLLAPVFDATEAARRLRSSPERALDEALLDQRVLAGVGNVFKSEILFEAGLHPERIVASLSDAELAALLGTAERLLRANGSIAGSRFLPGGQRRTTGRLDPAQALWVYGRAGEPCRRCGEPVVLTRRGEAARLTYLCPRCQPALR